MFIIFWKLLEEESWRVGLGEETKLQVSMCCKNCLVGMNFEQEMHCKEMLFFIIFLYDFSLESFRSNSFDYASNLFTDT